jgi:uncharacterized protein (TIGR02186 family)
MNSLRLGLILGIAGLLPQASANTPSVKLEPPVIRMGAFYSGEWMRISGTVAPGSKVIVLLRGPRTEEVFNRKGRVGPIWINTGKVHISGVPSLFLCYSSEPVENLLHRDEIERRQLDDAAIRRQMIVTPKELDHADVRADFIELKTEDNVYRMIADGVEMGTPGPDGVPYSVRFHWPRKAPPDHYQIRVYECRDGLLVGRATALLDVVKIGFPEFMAYQATEHSSWYGIAAVLIAALGGFGIDFLVALLRKKLRREPAGASDLAASHEQPKEVRR